MNPYQILNVPMNAPFDQITAKFRSLAEQIDPDDANALDYYSNIVEAYNILCDPRSRYELDSRLMAGEQGRTYMSDDFSHSEGYKPYSAADLIVVMSEIRRLAASAKQDAKQFAINGLLWFIGGIVVTAISAAIGYGVVACGAIIVGGFEAIKGLVEYCKVNGKIKNVNETFWAQYLRIPVPPTAG